VVVEYGMTLETLYEMLGAFGSQDGFTREIWALIKRVEADQETEHQAPGGSVIEIERLPRLYLHP
jgi:carbohydrate-binding DOMON domain-containing protein